MKISDEPQNKYKYKCYKGKLTTEHRYVMHMTNPRDDEDDLVVHHIDGNKANNDPSNLVWMTREEHSRYHHLGEKHFPCSGEANANYRHGMCVNGMTPEYKKLHSHKTYMKHRETRLAKQSAYAAEHREHKRWYDKVRHWKKELETALTDERRNECALRLKELEENPV